MAYSRFGGSRWYTFWHVRLDKDPETRDNARFEVCCVTSFTAKQLRDEIDECLTVVKDHKEGADATDEELEELRGYMLEFLADVDAQYAVRQ